MGFKTKNKSNILHKSHPIMVPTQIVEAIASILLKCLHAESMLIASLNTTASRTLTATLQWAVRYSFTVLIANSIKGQQILQC
jgi:hypothetical protein